MLLRSVEKALSVCVCGKEGARLRFLLMKQESISLE